MKTFALSLGLIAIGIFSTSSLVASEVIEEPSFYAYDEATNTVTITRDDGNQITYQPTRVSVEDDSSRHLFTALKAEEKQVYRMYAYAWENKENDAGANKTYYYKVPLTKAGFMNGYNAFINDYTEAWNLLLAPVTYEETIGEVVYVTGVVISISMWDYPEKLERFETAVEEWRGWYEEATEGMRRRSDKIRALFDLVVSKVRYDDSAGGGFATGDALPLHTAYGPIVNKMSVCEGYAKAFGYLAREFGLNDYVVTLCGDGWDYRVAKYVSHCWNAVKLSDGRWYQIDPTWNEYTGGFNTTYHDLYGVSEAWWETASAAPLDPEILPPEPEPDPGTGGGGGTPDSGDEEPDPGTGGEEPDPGTGGEGEGEGEGEDPDTGDEGDDPEPETPYSGTFYVTGANASRYDANKLADGSQSKLCWAYAFASQIAWYQDMHETVEGNSKLPGSYPRTVAEIVEIIQGFTTNVSGSFPTAVEAYLGNDYLYGYVSSLAWNPYNPTAYKSYYKSSNPEYFGSIEGFSALLLENLYRGPAFMDLYLPNSTASGHAVALWGADFENGVVTAIYIADSDDDEKPVGFTRYPVSYTDEWIRIGDNYWAPRVNAVTFIWAPKGVTTTPPVNGEIGNPNPDPGTGGGGGTPDSGDEEPDPGTGGEEPDPGTGGGGETPNPDPEEPTDPSLPDVDNPPVLNVTELFYTDLERARMVAVASKKQLFVLSGRSGCPYYLAAKAHLEGLGTEFSSKFVVYLALTDQGAVLSGASPQYGTFDPRTINAAKGWTPTSNYYDQGTGYSEGAINVCIAKANEKTLGTLTGVEIIGSATGFAGSSSTYLCMASFSDGVTMVLPQAYLTWGASSGTVRNGLFTLPSTISVGETVTLAARFPTALQTNNLVSRTITVIDPTSIKTIAIGGETSLNLADSTDIVLTCLATFTDETTEEIPVSSWSVSVGEVLPYPTTIPANMTLRETPKPTLDSTGRLTYESYKISDHTLTVTARQGEHTATKTFTVYAPSRAWPVEVEPLTTGDLWPEDEIRLQVKKVAYTYGGKVVETTDVEAFTFWIKLDATDHNSLYNVIADKGMTTQTEGGVLTAVFPYYTFGRTLNAELYLYCSKSGSPQGDDTNQSLNATLSAAYTIAANNGNPRPEPETPTETTVKLRNGHELRVPHTWVKQYFPECTDFATQLENDWDNDGFTDAEEYFIGTNPKEKADRLKIEAISFDENNKPTFTIYPKTPGDSASFILYGSETPSGPWNKHEDSNTTHRFFRVRVEPKQ